MRKKPAFYSRVVTSNFGYMKKNHVAWHTKSKHKSVSKMVDQDEFGLLVCFFFLRYCSNDGKNGFVFPRPENSL